MTGKNIFEAMYDIDSQMLLDAAPNKKTSRVWVKVISLAACLVLIVTAIAIIPILKDQENDYTGAFSFINNTAYVRLNYFQSFEEFSEQVLENSIFKDLDIEDGYDITYCAYFPFESMENSTEENEYTNWCIDIKYEDDCNISVNMSLKDKDTVTEYPEKSSLKNMLTINGLTVYYQYNSDMEILEGVFEYNDNPYYITIDGDRIDVLEELMEVLTTGEIDEARKPIEPKQAACDKPKLTEFNTEVAYANETYSAKLRSNAINAFKLYDNAVKRFPIYKFDTLEELQKFKESFGEILNVDYGCNEVPSFNSITAKYDSTFFEENTLLVIYAGINTWQEKLEINSICCDGKLLCVHIDQVEGSQVYSELIPGFLITVAISDDAIKGCTDFDAKLNSSTD